MAAWELLTGKVVNAGATFTGLTMATGDSLAVRSAPLDSGAVLENVWGLGAAAGIIRIRTPRMHDNVQGIRVGYAAATPQPLFPDPVEQTLYAQDILTVEATGGGAETDVVVMQVYYPNLPGSSGRFETWESIAPRVEQFVTQEMQFTSGATLGDYGGQLALNANFDLLKANTDYAVLGYLSSVGCAAVGLRGIDTGNLRVGGPGTTNRIETRGWFIEQSKWTNRPHIPVMNAANKAGTLLDVVHNAAATAITVQLFLAQLRGA